MKPLVIVVAGPGSMPRIAMDILAAHGRPLQGYLQIGQVVWGYDRAPARLGDTAYLDDPRFCTGREFVIAVGMGPVSSDLGAASVGGRIEAAGGTVLSIIHPSAIISASATIGAGTLISAGVVVQMDARIGRYCALHTACTVDHDDVIEDAVSISPGAHLAGGVRVGSGSFIGAGAVLVNAVTIGRGATVGAGAVVLKDVADGITVVGNPARPLSR